MSGGRNPAGVNEIKMVHFPTNSILGGAAGTCFARVALLPLLLAGAVLFCAEARGDEPVDRNAVVMILPQGLDEELGEVFAGRLRQVAGLDARIVASEMLPEANLDPGLVALEERARSLELEMSFREAANAWRSYRDGLLDSTGPLLRPVLLAEAQLALAASWVECGELELARLEFRRALGVDESFEAGLAYSPRVRSFFEEAGHDGPGLAPAFTDEIMDDFLVSIDGDFFVWVAFGMDEGGWIVSRRLRAAGQESSSTEIRRRLSEEPHAGSSEVQAEAARVALEIQEAFDKEGVGAETWRSRRTWLIVGAAAVSTTLVAGAAAAHVSRPSMIEIVVRH